MNELLFPCGLFTYQDMSSSMADLDLNDCNPGLQIDSELVEETMSVEKFSLLPGLPDELTIDYIVTKVSSWKTLCLLSTINKAWHGAISNRKIHDARVRTNSTQTLVVIIHEDFLQSPPELPDKKNCTRDSETNEELEDSSPVHFPLAISLYDPGTDAWSRLPRIQGLAEGIPHESECVCSKGKVYILGGLGNTKHPMNNVYMLDLGAGHGAWQQCASMHRERARYCEVNGGKIFAFGGTSKCQEVLAECEVFDMEQNVWSSIPPMLHRRTDHKVALSEGQFYIHGGLFWKESLYDNDDDGDDMWFEDLEQPPHLHDAQFAEVFDPCTKQWRTLHNFKRGMQGPILKVDGKLVNLSMSINHNSVETYSGHSNSWISSQPISWNISEPGVSGKVSFRWPMYVLYQAIGLENEVLAWLSSVRHIEKNWQRNYLLKSKGFGSKSSSLEWEKMGRSNDFPEPILCMRRINL